MASSSTTPSSEHQTVDVKVLSQLDGPDRSIELPSVPLLSTVGDLKRRIRDHMSSLPSPESQRLIHRGRLMAKDDETLATVFGKDTTQQVLHLVIRDHAAGSTVVQPPHSTVPAIAQIPSQLHAPNNPSPLGPQPSSAPASRSATPGLNQTGHVPHAHQHPQHHHAHPHVPPHPHMHQHAMHAWPPFQDMNNNFQHPMRYPAHMPQNGAARQVVFHPPIAVPPGTIAQHFGPGLGQQNHQSGPNDPQARPGNGNTDANQTTARQFPILPNGFPPQDHAQHGQVPHTHGFNQPPTYTQGVNPDGSRYTMMTYSTTTTFPMQGQQIPQQMPNLVNSNFQPFPSVADIMQGHPRQPDQMPNRSTSQAHTAPPSAAPSQTPPEYGGPQATIQIMRGLDDDLENLEVRASRLLRGGGMGQTLPYAADGISRELRDLIRRRNRYQQMVNSILRQDPSQQGVIETTDAHTLQALNENFSQRTGTIRGKLRELGSGSGVHGLTSSSMSSSNRTNLPDRASPPMLNASSSHNPLLSSEPVTAYLVNAPNGPYALVHSPQGTFASTRSVPDPSTSRNLTQDTDDLINRTHQLLNQARNGTLNRERRSRRASPQPPNEARNDQGREQNNVAGPAVPPAARDGNQNNDEVRVLEPVLHALWVLIRLFGFVWFFSGGSSRRTWLLILSAAVVFAAQAGLFGDRMERVRRHFENLFGVPNEDRPQNQQQQNALQPRNQQQDQAVGQNQQEGPVERDHRRTRVHQTEPDPRVTAERLLGEARETRQNRLRNFLRPIERGVVLFFASLYPGIGERHVAARERQQREALALANQPEAAAALPAPSTEGEPSQPSTETTGQETESTADSSSKEQQGRLASSEDAGEGSSSSANVAAGTDGELRQRHGGSDTQSSPAGASR